MQNCNQRTTSLCYYSCKMPGEGVVMSDGHMIGRSSSKVNPDILQHIQEAPTNPAVFKPFLLLGLLANFNKFEFRNPYRLRLEDFVNETTIRTVAYGFGATCSLSRDRYITVHEDVDESWSVGTTLSYIGLGALAPSKATPPSLSDDAAKGAFAELWVHQ